jgi:hypothetical protein
MRKLQDEAAGLLVKRGLFPEDSTEKGHWQSFTLINQELAFQENLVRHIRDLVQTPPSSQNNERSEEYKKLLNDLLVKNIESLASPDYIRQQSYFEKYSLSFPPESKLLLTDASGLIWTDSLLLGHSFLGFPIGEELRLLIVELLSFTLIVRFHSSVFLGAVVAYAISHFYLLIRNSIYKSVLARSIGIDSRFLL